jgi:sulfite reductase beta subunit-like hemoprotein
VARVVIADVAHHVTQRGNGRQFILATDAERWLHRSDISWREFRVEEEAESDLRAIRRCTYTGRPLGPAQFTRTLEERTQRRLTPSPRGRPRKMSEAHAAWTSQG